MKFNNLALYNSVKKTLQKAQQRAKASGHTFVMPALEPHSLIMETQAVTGNGNLSLYINENTGPAARTTESKLGQNDGFVVSEVGLFIKKEDPAKAGKGLLYSYPLAAVFPTEAGNLLNADLEAIFNSSLAITIGNENKVKKLHLRRCRVVNTSTTEQKETDGYIEVVPRFAFDGGSANTLTLNIPTWPGQQLQYVTDTDRLWITVIFHGFLLRGGGKLAINFNK